MFQCILKRFRRFSRSAFQSCWNAFHSASEILYTCLHLFILVISWNPDVHSSNYLPIQGIHYFFSRLGGLARTERDIYISKVVCSGASWGLRMEVCKPVSTLVDPNLKLSAHDDTELVWYRKLVSSLISLWSRWMLLSTGSLPVPWSPPFFSRLLDLTGPEGDGCFSISEACQLSLEQHARSKLLDKVCESGILTGKQVAEFYGTCKQPQMVASWMLLNRGMMISFCVEFSIIPQCFYI